MGPGQWSAGQCVKRWRSRVVVVVRARAPVSPAQ